MANPSDCDCCGPPCNPPRCLCSPPPFGLVVAFFGGNCPACLPTGTPIPLFFSELQGSTFNCPNFWRNACGTGVNCTESLATYQLPDCCPHPGQPLDLCDPEIRLGCFRGATDQQSYFLTLQFRALGSAPHGGGLIMWYSSSVQCDPFEVEFNDPPVQILGNPCLLDIPTALVYRV